MQGEPCKLRLFRAKCGNSRQCAAYSRQTPASHSIPLDRWQTGVPPDQRSEFPLNMVTFIVLPHPVDRWNELGGSSCERANRGFLNLPFRRLAVSPFGNSRCSAAHSVGQRMDFHNILVIMDLGRPALSVVPLSILRGGVVFPFLIRPLANGARRTADLFMIQFEQNVPWFCQEHFKPTLARVPQ
jgi:hypothetical protein